MPWPTSRTGQDVGRRAALRVAPLRIHNLATVPTESTQPPCPGIDVQEPTLQMHPRRRSEDGHDHTVCQRPECLRVPPLEDWHGRLWDSVALDHETAATTLTETDTHAASPMTSLSRTPHGPGQRKTRRRREVESLAQGHTELGLEPRLGSEPLCPAVVTSEKESGTRFLGGGV